MKKYTRKYYFVQDNTGDWDEQFTSKKQAISFAKELNEARPDFPYKAEVSLYKGEDNDEKAEYLETIQV